MEFREAMKKAETGERPFSAISAGIHFDKIEELFKTYGKTGKKRYYLHSDEEAAEYIRLGTKLTRR